VGGAFLALVHLCGFFFNIDMKNDATEISPMGEISLFAKLFHQLDSVLFKNQRGDTMGTAPDNSHQGDDLASSSEPAGVDALAIRFAPKEVLVDHRADGSILLAAWTTSLTTWPTGPWPRRSAPSWHRRPLTAPGRR